MPVTLVSSPESLPVDPPPGLFVVMAGDSPVDASALAERLGAEAVLSPAEAAVEIDMRCAAPVEDATVTERAERREALLERARQDAADALARVPAGARRAPVPRLRSAAAAVRAGHDAVAEARALLGERPELPTEAAEAALAAEEAVGRALAQRAVGVDRSSSLLLAANAVGILLVAARIRTPSVEPLFLAMAAFPLAALAHLVVTWMSKTLQARTAARLRTEALRKTGLATMTGLAARHARVAAWAARAEAVAAAEAAVVQARKRWTGLAGAATDPAHVEALVRTVQEAERTAAVVAELEALEAVSIDASPDPARPVVMLIAGAAGDPLDGQVRAILERLEQGVMTAPVVVATTSSEVRAWAESHAVKPAGAQVVDLRERVLASLDRLRNRAASFGDPAAPNSIAADG